MRNLLRSDFPGGLDATIVEKMSEDVQQGSASERKKGGICCVAGTVNSISSKNGSYTPNVSVHKFPVDPATRSEWVKLSLFVSIGRISRDREFLTSKRVASPE